MIRSLDAKGWVKVSIATHVAILGMAVAAYVMHMQLDVFWRSILFVLAVFLVYLLLTQGPPAGREQVPAFVRGYFWVLVVLMFMILNILFIIGYDIPSLPFRLVLVGVLIPFAMLLRIKAR